MLGVLKCQIKLLGHVGGDGLQVGLCQRLAKADAATSVECSHAHIVALLACRRQRELVAHVKAVWEELVSTLPFGRVTGHVSDVDREVVALLEVVLVNLSIFLERVSARLGSRGTEAESFKSDPSRELKIESGLQV